MMYVIIGFIVISTLSFILTIKYSSKRATEEEELYLKEYDNKNKKRR